MPTHCGLTHNPAPLLPNDGSSRGVAAESCANCLPPYRISGSPPRAADALPAHLHRGLQQPLAPHRQHHAGVIPLQPGIGAIAQHKKGLLEVPGCLQCSEGQG